MPDTLPVFSKDEFVKAHKYLAAQVATMMGRKFEENDWTAVYAAAKGIPAAGWSNLNIDVTHGNLGVEQKMICRRSRESILSACGTRIMHPAGTRSIRIPAVKDATEAARDVLAQYAALIDERTSLVRIADEYNHKQITREQAVKRILQIFPDMKPQVAAKRLSEQPQPVSDAYSAREPDMRIGWFLWQESLVDFLYFEQPMSKPKPTDYYAEWSESGGGGPRKKSKNLWVYNAKTKVKEFSITTEAGAKIQPYFTVPTPDDPNLCHFVVQGEELSPGKYRIWLTHVTASFLRHKLGSLDTEIVSKAILETNPPSASTPNPDWVFEVKATSIIVSAEAYQALANKFPVVSDEHRIHQMLEVI
ncbi:hypothetical protein [Bradyrhizobium sp. dw_78]|uniref:hypothetical protein n=1 Tax=Bradyrhizobium sp. dw_78 TaxID=2719793 RepID=UPI001BD23BE6|nr:hypothetical protein [Bradyrhizobium sp. dw_78]